MFEWFHFVDHSFYARFSIALLLLKISAQFFVNLVLWCPTRLDTSDQSCGIKVLHSSTSLGEKCQRHIVLCSDHKAGAQHVLQVVPPEEVLADVLFRRCRCPPIPPILLPL